MYIRKLKKGNKTYSYYYKSERIGNKVRSIYVGRALDEEIKKPARIERKEILKNSDKRSIIIKDLLEFDNLLNEINVLIGKKDLGNAIFLYNKMFDIYKSMEIDYDEKNKIFEKLSNVYSNLVELSKESKINLA